MEPMNHGQYNHAADEIDLFDLIDDIKEQWLWVLGSVLFCVMGAAGYYLKPVTPIYKAEAIVHPVTDLDLIHLNQPSMRELLGVVEKIEGANRFVTAYITKSEAFSEFREIIRSQSTLSMFSDYRAMQGETSDVGVGQLSTGFIFGDPGAKEKDVYLKVSYQSPDAEDAAKIVNEYVKFALNKQKQDQIAAINMIISGQISNWKLASKQSSGDSSAAWKLKAAEQVNIEWDKINFVNFDHQAQASSNPINKKKPLVLAIGLVLGGMIGIVTALIAAAAKRRKASKLQEITN